MKQQYRMTDEELAELLEASRPVPYMVFGGVEPTSPYEHAMVCVEQDLRSGGSKPRIGCTSIYR